MRAERLAGVVALVLAVAYLLAPPMGTDLSAQVARARFFADHGLTPIDLGWYGGINQFGYSLLSAPLGAALGVRVLGGLAAVVGAVAFGWLLARGGARRPLLGAVLGAVILVGNLVSGRVTFAVGLALGLLALCTLAQPPVATAAPAAAAPRPGRRFRLAGAALLAALATWASPVAGLFTGLAGGALLLADLWRRGDEPRRVRAESLVLCLAPAVALLPMAVLFGNGGAQPFTAESMRINVALAVAVALLVPHWVIRVGAALAALLLVAVFYLPSPIGSNALRLPMLFALPVVAAFAPLGARWLAAVLVALVWWQSPVVIGDLTRAGSAETRAAFYRPLTDELVRRGPVGRIEVVPLRDHWEAAYVPATVPLARGWERQVDVDRNPLFYRTALDPAAYRAWLRDNAVNYVAVADSPPDVYGRQEAALVASGPDYLREVWRDPVWRLYEVVDPAPLVAAPGRLVESTNGGVTLAVDAPGEVLVRIRWSRWLTADGAARLGRRGSWTVLHAPKAGRYTVSG
jgi:hypothetical protein